MNIIKEKLEIITPMYSYSASECEFRITELKSLIRFVFRGIYQLDSIADMHIVEGMLFGDTNQKSPILLKVNHKTIRNKRFYMLPHKTDKSAYQYAIIPEQKISIELISKYDLDIYKNLLFLASIIGGLGKRSRRGFGAFCLEYGNNKDTLLDLLQYILDSINSVDINGFQRHNGKLVSCNKNIKLRNYEFKQNGSWNILHFNKNKIGGYSYIKNISFKEISSESIRTKSGKEDYKLSNIIKMIGNESKHRMGKDYYEGLFNKAILGDYKRRFASPVYVSFSKLNNKYYLIITELNYDYIKHGTNDIGYVDHFIEELKNLG